MSDKKLPSAFQKALGKSPSLEEGRPHFNRNQQLAAAQGKGKAAMQRLTTMGHTSHGFKPKET